MSFNALRNKDSAFFEKLLQKSNSSIILTDPTLPDNPIVFVNKRFEETTGYRADDVVGKNCRFLQRADRDQEAIPVLRKAIAEGEPCECIIRNYRRNGDAFWNRLYLYPIDDATGRTINFVGIQHDVTDSHVNRLLLEEKNNAINSSADVYIKLNKAGFILEANPAAEAVFGWAVQELVGSHASLLVSKARAAQAASNLLALFSSETSSTITQMYLRKDGASVWMEWTVTPGADDASLIAFGRDVTQRRMAEQDARQERERVASILESISEGCFTLDREWVFTYINRQGAHWLNRPAEQLKGKNIWQEFPDAIGSPFDAAYRRAADGNFPTRCEAYYPPLDKWFEARAYPREGNLTVFYQDISERKKNEERLIYSARHDQLTGLLNRASCMQLLNDWLKRARSDGKHLAVLFIDLDRLKEVNDAFGHQAGDKVLSALAQRFSSLANAQCVPGRISGDEFIFLLYDHDESSARVFAEQLLRIIAQPILASATEVSVGASIGIAFDNLDQLSADELVNHADTAMYAAKAAGRHTFNIFSKNLSQWDRMRHQLRGDLVPALNAGQFVLYYQPQARLDDGVAGAEALIRWQHPEFGLLMPDAFIGLAEESPFILELGAWVIDEACRQLAEWNASHALIISVNVSARQLSHPGLPELMESSVAKYKLDPGCIKIEVTESMLAQDLHHCSDILGTLRNKGFRIALDDFGTGYSNLSYINRFPVTTIKIDRSFIRDIETNPSALALVNGIIALASSLDLSVICEGVETEGQRQLLKQTRCNSIQGYLIGRPMPPDRFYSTCLVGR